MVEGHTPTIGQLCSALDANFDDSSHRRIHVRKHNRRRNPESRDPLRAQEMRSRSVPIYCIARIMPKTIHLNREPRCRTIEIDHINSCRMLAAKLETARALAKCPP
jgi:hypothetical protein